MSYDFSTKNMSKLNGAEVKFYSVSNRHFKRGQSEILKKSSNRHTKVVNLETYIAK